jgi:hypothetical protein
MKKIKLTPLLLSDASRRARVILAVLFFERVLVQNYLPEPNDFIGLNNSEVTLTASMFTSDSNVLHLTTIDRDIKLKGKSIDTPNGWGYLVIGS